MDPNANLAEQAEIFERILTNESVWDKDDAVRLAELTSSLNAWIQNGGFLPDVWKQ